MAFRRYSKYRSFRRRATYGRRKTFRRRRFMKGFNIKPAKYLKAAKPEIKFLDSVTDITSITSTVPLVQAVSPTAFTQGVAEGQVIGKKLSSRWLTGHMFVQGPQNLPTTVNNPDVLMRVVYWTPNNDYVAASSYMQSTSITSLYGGTQAIFDWNYVIIHKDFKFVIARTYVNDTVTNQNVSMHNKIQRKVALKFKRNMELTNPAAGIMNVNQNKDVMFVTVYTSTTSACSFTLNLRITYTDS